MLLVVGVLVVIRRSLRQWSPMLCVYRVETGILSGHYNDSDGVMTSSHLTLSQKLNKIDKGLISTDIVQEIVHAESNGHVTDYVTRPYNVIMVT